MRPPLLELKGISKSFSGTLALEEVDFSVNSGEVQVLFGENGAGKSTLISIIAGALSPDKGEFGFKNEPVRIYSVHHARSLGISAVFQEFSLVPQMTVEENLFLGSEISKFGLLNKNSSHKQSSEILNRLGFDLRPNQRIEFLSRAEQQMVEIAKAFRDNLSVLILDEPTASLTEKETEQLFELINLVKKDGVGIIYITHRISEIRRIGDRITVLRDGKNVGTSSADVPEKELVRMMTGKVFDQIFPKIEFNPSQKVLEIDNLTTRNGAVQDLSINVSAGEIVGIAGLLGSGKSEIGRACFGLLDIASGQIRFDGKDVRGNLPGEMLDLGLYYVPPDRRDEGLIMSRPSRESISMSALTTPDLSRGLFVRLREEKNKANNLAKKMNLQPHNIEKTPNMFSGGNQQKIMLAKCLTREVKLFVFDEPTVGVDVGTRIAIYEFIAELCKNNAAVLVISSDLTEILHLPNRVYVMCRGSLSAELSGKEISQQMVLEHCFGHNAA